MRLLVAFRVLVALARGSADFAWGVSETMVCLMVSSCAQLAAPVEQLPAPPSPVAPVQSPPPPVPPSPVQSPLQTALLPGGPVDAVAGAAPAPGLPPAPAADALAGAVAPGGGASSGGCGCGQATAGAAGISGSLGGKGKKKGNGNGKGAGGASSGKGTQGTTGQVPPADVSKWVKGDVSGLDATLLAKLAQIGEQLGKVIDIRSGLRSREEQEALYAKYKAGTGALAAPPGQSNHESGDAADVYIGGTALRDNAEAKRIALQLGLAFPVSSESWHVELA